MPKFQVILTEQEWEDINAQLDRIPVLERDAKEYRKLLETPGRVER